MIRNSKSLYALSVLFLCIFFTSRYIQRILFEKDLLHTPITKLKLKSNKCEPKADSILTYYSNNYKNVLYVVIDAFPNPRVYEDLAGKESKLHQFLNESATETVYVSGASQKTTSSLPYLMGKISPLDNCKYPFFRGSIKPNLIINSQFLATNKALCPIIYNSVSRNSFIRYKNKIRKVIDKNYANKLKAALVNCSLTDKVTIKKAVKKLGSSSLSAKGSINFFHDMQYRNNRKASVAYYDSEYYESIKYLIKSLKESTIIDELIVMNDHGPRIVKKNFSPANLEELRIYDDMYYGIFVSRFKLSKDKTNIDQKILKKLIPSSKVRFCDDGYGNIKKIQDLKELETCY